MSVKKKKKLSLAQAAKLGAAFDTTSTTTNVAAGYSIPVPPRHVSKEQADIALQILRTSQNCAERLHADAERVLRAYLEANHAKIEATTIGSNTWTFGPTSIGTF